MYSTAPAQEQGAKLPASRHRRLDFSQNSGQQCFLRNYNRNQVKKKKIQVSYLEKVYYDDIFCYREPDSGYWHLSDFKWLCLECVRQNRMKENE